MSILPSAVTEVKVLISTSDEAKEMGRWDAEHGNRCQSGAYAYPSEWEAPYFQADYTFAYIKAKGL